VAYGSRTAKGGPGALTGLGAMGGPGGAAVRYAASLTRRLYSKATPAFSPAVRMGKASSSRAGTWYASHASFSGCSKEVSSAGFCEAGFRLGVASALAGAFIGMLISVEMAAVLGLVGAFVGGGMPKRGVRAAGRERSLCARRYLSEMLEVVALGLRSGLTFDRSFGLYGSHFDNAFARSCAKAHRSWSIGLVTREEALRELAASYECGQLTHVVDGIIRSLRFGAPLTEALEDAASQSRAEFRTALEERVAKAPIKMMLPTGTLILPAMLLLVMGPILLELAGGFS